MNSSVRYGPFLSKALPNHCDAATKIWPDSSILLPSHSSYRRGITLEFYRQRHGIQPDTIFTIDLKERAQQLRIFRGKRRGRATRQVRIWTEDVPTIILHALALQHFIRW